MPLRKTTIHKRKYLQASLKENVYFAFKIIFFITNQTVYLYRLAPPAPIEFSHRDITY